MGRRSSWSRSSGEFPWHHHEHEDEFFLVWKGNFRVEFRDHVVSLGPGECVVVPRGVEHRTCARMKKRRFFALNREAY